MKTGSRESIWGDCMKYKTLKQSDKKVLKINNLSGGADFSDPRSQISQKKLSNVLNMAYTDGRITARLGLYADTASVIESHALDYSNIYTYEFIGGKVSVNGESNDVVGVIQLTDNSFYYLKIYFIDGSGNKKYTGSINFLRYSDDSFYQPGKVVFYNASPVSGGGIFAFVTTKNIYNVKETSYRIYEISTDLSSWNQITDFYIPTVYINGRGTRYEEAKVQGNAFTGQPKFLESMNMLTNRFKCYFTSDGSSSCFRLPFSGLSDDSVICRVYGAPNYYVDWVIGANTSSKTEKFYSVDITLNVDREKGIIYFSVPSGDYEIPSARLYHENNICVTASKITENSFSKGTVCTSCAVSGSGLVFSGGTDGDRIISVSPKNPLYFPCDSSAVVGEKGTKITALVYHKNSIYAFKKNEVYSVKVKKGDIISSISLLADDDAVFYDDDTFEISKIFGKTGCESENSCTVYNGYLTWFGSDRKVYKLDSSYKVTELSEDVNSKIDSIKKTSYSRGFSAVLGKYYALIIGYKAFIMEYGKNKEPCWYLWDFGDIRVIGVYNNSAESRILCAGSDENALYTAKLSGDKDIDIRHERSQDSPTLNSVNIPCSLSTAHFDFGSLCEKKILNSILLSIATEDYVKIYINSKYFDRINLSGNRADCVCGALNTVKLIPHMYGLNSVYITLESDKGFSLGELDISYEKTQN